MNTQQMLKTPKSQIMMTVLLCLLQRQRTSIAFQENGQKEHQNIISHGFIPNTHHRARGVEAVQLPPGTPVLYKIIHIPVRLLALLMLEI
jgi:hypothetical protein